MAKYYYTSGKRKGKVYQEFYYTLNGQQIVDKKSFYCPVNTKWLSKVEFRQYIIQVINDYYPNYLVVDELPEQLDPHVIYFLKQETEDHAIYYDVYVFFEDEMKQIVFKGVDIPELPLIKQTINEIISNSLKKIYNTTLTADKLIYTDNDGCLAASDISKIDAKDVIDSVKNKCLSDIYNKNLTANKLLGSNFSGKIYATEINPITATNVITGVTTKSLQNLYSDTVDADKVIVSNSSGVLVASDISKTDAKDVVDGVKNGSIKKIYSSTQTTGRLVYTDSEGCLNISSVYESHTKAVVNGVRGNCLSNIYNKNLIANRLLSSNGSGKIYATDIHPTTAANVINGVSTKSLKNVYNTTLDAYKFLGTDQNGFVTTVDRPHLFAHHFVYDKSGRGEVNFIVYSPLSSEIDNTTLGDYFSALGCTEYYRAYPAYGQSQRTGGIVSGVYVKQNTIPFVKYTIWVNSYTIGGNYQEEIGNYPDSTKIYITEVF